MVRYKIKADRVAENERYITSVFEQLEREKPPGLRYASFKLEDGVSFMHVALVETEDGSILAVQWHPEAGKDTSLFATMRFAWAMTRVDGKSGLTCGVPIADLAVHWDTERALALLNLVKTDHTGDIPKRLCQPTGLANQ